MDFEGNYEGTDRKSVLRKYFALYLQNVRRLSNSSVKHYFDALNNVSRRLKEKDLVKYDIYEISDLNRLNTVREILYADLEFKALNCIFLNVRPMLTDFEIHSHVV